MHLKNYYVDEITGSFGNKPTPPSVACVVCYLSPPPKVPPPKMPIRSVVKLLKIEISMTTDTNSLCSQ